MVDVDGYEGPLDLLLDLARRQKVDLHRISILALAEQYLVFVEEARALRLELAADYLVMAAWLAYLKSRLLLPEPPKGEEPSAADLATALALRLRRLEAIRAAARRLASRERLGVDVFARGAPEAVVAGARPVWEAELYDLLAAYAQQRQKRVQGHISVGHRLVWSLVEAREALQRLVGEAGDWTEIDPYLTRYMASHGLPAREMSATVQGVGALGHAGDGAGRGARPAPGRCVRAALSAPPLGPAAEPAAVSRDETPMAMAGRRGRG